MRTSSSLLNLLNRAFNDDNIVWGNIDDDNIVWGNSDDNIVWGNNDDNIVWGNVASAAGQREGRQVMEKMPYQPDLDRAMTTATTATERLAATGATRCRCWSARK